jgi:transcription elongation factor
MYVLDGSEGQLIAGHPLKERTMHYKQSHLMTVDKVVAEIKVGDAFLDKEDQQQEQSINFYPKDQGLFISDFDSFMEKGNPIIK